MPGTQNGRLQARSLRDWLTDEPYRFEFYQTVRLLEAFQPRALLSAGTQMAGPESVRFSSRVSFAFPASEVQHLEWGKSAARLTVNILGLAGCLGPLPHAYTQMVLDAAGRKDRAAADFLDIFNHRLIALLYRVRQAHEPALTARAPYEGSFADHLFAIIGLAIPAARRNLGFPAQALLHYSGLVARQPRTPAGLEAMLQDYFDVPVRVHQFYGTWREINDSEWTTIGRTGKNRALGTSVVLGKRVWDQAGALAIAVGPLTLSRFQSFLPGSPNHSLLSGLLKFYLGVQHKPLIHLRLKGSDVPQLRLGQSRLGYDSWTRVRPYLPSSATVRIKTAN